MSYDDPFHAPHEPFGTGEYGELSHSGLGIASCIIGGLAGLIEVAIVTIAGMIEVSAPGGMDENSPEAIMIGLGLFAGLGIAMLGIGLGIGGLIQRRKKLFAVFGILISLFVTCGVAGLFVLGLMAE
ncbi:MAG TPA: hypothetical protein VHB99_14215 [Pirellulales bacterium]|nr:hypothetical protein [Pirellulales bacterium]